MVWRVECERCQRTFGLYSAWAQHIRDSPNHNECPVCDYDGATWQDLLKHCRQKGCRTVCQGCDDGRGAHWALDCDEYYEHLHECNQCITCHRHFDTPSNLYQHMISHRRAKYECYECDATFKTYGGMIIHIERGTCGDFDHADLNMLAAQCRKWADFINYECCQLDLLDYGVTHCHASPFKCPTCDASMAKLSSLFQHVESDSCEQKLGYGAVGTLRNFLRRRLA